MNPLHAAVLGAVQGLTEILPISSSAHLILIPRFLHWPESGLTFDVALHLGTFIALSLYFWRDIIELCFSFCKGVTGKGLHTPADRLPFYIIAATIPAAIAGKTLEEPIEQIFRASPLLIAGFLIAFGHHPRPCRHHRREAVEDGPDHPQVRPDHRPRPVPGPDARRFPLGHHHHRGTAHRLQPGSGGPFFLPPLPPRRRRGGAPQAGAPGQSTAFPPEKRRPCSSASPPPPSSAT